MKLEGSELVDGTTGAESRNVFCGCWTFSELGWCINGEVRRDGKDADGPVDNRFRAPSSKLYGAARLLGRGDGVALSRFPALGGSN